MGISRMAALQIKNSREKDLEIVVGDTPEDNGKYACALWRTDYSPSGCPRPDLLLSTQGVFDSAEDARKFLTDLVKEIRGMTDEQLWGPS